MKKYPKITIVTPSFNQGQFLERTILSVLNQNYPNLEYIVIDGGSRDNSVEIIKKYADRLSFWLSERDEGMYDALQKGFSKAGGDIMGWINSDDMLHPHSLFTLASVFTDISKVEWITGVPNSFDETDKIIGVGQIPRWSAVKFYSGQYKWIQQESTFWKRSLWERAGSYISEEYKFAGDFELWARFFLHGELYSVSTILGGFRWRNSNQLSLDHKNEYEAESEKIIDKYRERLSDEIKNDIRALQRYSDTYKKIPLLRRLKFKSDKDFYKYTPVIEFGRSEQKFRLRK